MADTECLYLRDAMHTKLNDTFLACLRERCMSQPNYPELSNSSTVEVWQCSGPDQPQGIPKRRWWKSVEGDTEWMPELPSLFLWTPPVSPTPDFVLPISLQQNKTTESLPCHWDMASLSSFGSHPEIITEHLWHAGYYEMHPRSVWSRSTVPFSLGSIFLKGL